MEESPGLREEPFRGAELGSGARGEVCTWKGDLETEAPLRGGKEGVGARGRGVTRL